MILVVDGNDLTPFIQEKQYTVTRSDMDGPNAGRTMDGKMHRDYLDNKRKIEVKFIPLFTSDWAMIEHMVLRGKEWHSVEFEDFGRPATATMYSSAFNGTVSTIDGRRIGAGVNFIEE